jgi:hypothetical protein
MDGAGNGHALLCILRLFAAVRFALSVFATFLKQLLRLELLAIPKEATAP